MVIFPGKSYETISMLIHKFEKKNEESEIIASKLDQQIQNLNQNDEFELSKYYYKIFYFNTYGFLHFSNLIQKIPCIYT